jgi:hypothetical protein
MVNTNAYIGMDVERLFKNSVRNSPDVIEQLRNHFSISGTFATSYKTGTDAGKSDVILKFSDGRTLSANIKAFKAGFNQVTRATIATFCGRFGTDSLKSIFDEAVIRVARRAGKFVLEADQELVATELHPIAQQIVQRSIAGDENPELLVLFDRGAGRMLIYDMAQILRDLDYSISFSGKGIIKIGKYFTIQRKGGNGVHSLHVPKDSLEHPGNGLQVKLNVRKFVNEVIPIVVYSP